MGNFRPRRWFALALRIVAIAALLLIFPQSAHARAGGGGGYSGGGGGGGFGGGGHGSGHGGDGGLIYLLIQLFINYPLVGISLVIIIAVFYVISQRKNAGMGPANSSPAVSAPSSDLALARRHEDLERLRAADPNFDAAAFYQRVGVAFRKIQAAWCAQNLATVRPFISDGVHERFSLQFAEQRAEGWRDQMDNIQVYHIALTELHSDGMFDELSVRIEAGAADYRVSLANGQRLSGSAAFSRFVEIWSFLRHRGAATQPGKAGLIEGHCPNCGAPVELNQAANCAHCKALLRSGLYDWVLSEITQEVEWTGERHVDVPGVKTLRLRDPEFNAVELEDRASVMYWRKVTADRIGKIDPLRKSASEAFCQTYAAALKPGPEGYRRSFAECAVGSVRLLGVIPDTQAGDRAIVEVRWSATLVILGQNNTLHLLSGQHLSYSLFVLWRQPGLRTDSGKGISSAHCPTCGAPQSNSASSACDFCGAVLNDGSQGWVLVEIAERSTTPGARLLDAINTVVYTE